MFRFGCWHLQLNKPSREDLYRCVFDVFRSILTKMQNTVQLLN